MSHLLPDETTAKSFTGLLGFLGTIVRNTVRSTTVRALARSRPRSGLSPSPSATMMQSKATIEIDIVGAASRPAPLAKARDSNQKALPNRKPTKLFEGRERGSIGRFSVIECAIVFSLRQHPARSLGAKLTSFDT